MPRPKLKTPERRRAQALALYSAWCLGFAVADAASDLADQGDERAAEQLRRGHIDFGSPAWDALDAERFPEVVARREQHRAAVEWGLARLAGLIAHEREAERLLKTDPPAAWAILRGLPVCYATSVLRRSGCWQCPKGRDPMNLSNWQRLPQTRETRRSCGAKTRAGGTCDALSVPGARRCRLHGGGTAPAKRKADASIRGSETVN